MYNSLELMFKRAVVLKIILINIAQMLSRKLVPFPFPFSVWRAAHFHILQEQEIILFKLLANSKWYIKQNISWLLFFLLLQKLNTISCVCWPSVFSYLWINVSWSLSVFLLGCFLFVRICYISLCIKNKSLDFFPQYSHFVYSFEGHSKVKFKLRNFSLLLRRLWCYDSKHFEQIKYTHTHN